jgi:hypothetical protein
MGDLSNACGITLLSISLDFLLPVGKARDMTRFKFDGVSAAVLNLAVPHCGSAVKLCYRFSIKISHVGSYAAERLNYFQFQVSKTVFTTR